VIVRALTWNLFHGRDAPPDPSLFTWRSRLLRIAERGEEHIQVNRDLSGEFSATLAKLDWDVALLQECPPRWVEALADACGAERHLVLTSRNSAPALRRLLAMLNPDLIASGEGGSNLTLIRGPLLELDRSAISERRKLVLRKRLPERRAMAFTRTSSGLCVGNLHATNDRTELAAEEVLNAAATATECAADAPLIFGGDFNLRPGRQPELFEELRERHGLAAPTGPGSIDHLLARGLAVIEAPRPLPPEQREVADPSSGLKIRLSDHAPVGATFEFTAPQTGVGASP
jgi:endonuclease/exonuclease/phosphatase family metal-dependent hydrolase